jgi:hypothetical protein
MCSLGGVPPVQLSHLQKFEVKEKLKIENNNKS